ncbi:MAG: hypothetical protein SFX73_02865 [Kofleriaceae bacterium]|nr:hypothetical protein [Kofleriaceae bacterium]
MMKPVLSFVLFGALVGCADSGAASSQLPGGGKADDQRVSVPLEIGRCADAANDDYQLADVKVEGNQLLVDVRYGGGCEEHTFRMCWDGGFAESLPVQARLKLHHDGNGDACEALRYTSLAVDLTTLARSYTEAYQQSTGEITVRLDDTWSSFSFGLMDAEALEAAFHVAAEGAVYYSETDSEAAWLATSEETEAPIDEALIREHFGEALDLASFEGTIGFEIERGQAVRDTLAQWAEYDDTDESYAEASQAFGRIKTLFEANLTELTFARIGSADEDGELLTDAGQYNLVVLGRTIDGKVVGFYVISVET